MAQYNHHTIGINIQPPPAQGTKVNTVFSHIPLQQVGFNMPVEITTATAFRQQQNPEPLKSILVMAHFDTGASITNIDTELAKYLNLISLGVQSSHTANGPMNNPVYAVDLHFPNVGLASFPNLKIGSCNLGFNLSDNQNNQNDPKNFGVLIGRDIMSRWNIVWNGPTSTVLISD